MPAARDVSETLGQRVRRLRVADGLTQGQLAARMRVTQARISQIEASTDARPLPLRTLCDLADGLGVDLEALIASDPLYEHLDLETASSLLPPVPSSLRAVSPFIDRGTELVAVLTALRDEETRLLTLVGPAGVGKTQLALQAAAALQPDLPEQAIVSLAPCFDTASLLTTLARAIGLRERDDQPLRQRLLTALHDRRMLLLLDNVEQALPAAATLTAELVAACPRLSLLVTSRAPLNIRDEQTYTVLPLGLPDSGSPVTLAAAANAPAVQLFTLRAGAAMPGFALTEANAGKITAICRCLDGLPLAIELAAPRTRVMSLDQLLRQLEHRLTLLTSGSRDLPARQQSLRANIAWSYDLLPPHAQILFRRLAVFAESFTLEAAVAVIGDNPTHATQFLAASSWSAADVTNGIAHLLEQHLLTRLEQPDGTPRFAMLETIQEFAREHLQAAREADALARRHLAWCLTLAERAAPKMFTGEEAWWLGHLQQEDANLQAALAWAVSSDQEADLEAGLCLAGALADYWFLCGLLGEGRDWLNQTLAHRTSHALSFGRSRALIGACLIAQTQGAVTPALDYGTAGLALATALDDQSTVGRALVYLGNLAMMEGRLSDAQAAHEQALTCFQHLGDQAWIAVALIDLGMDHERQGDHEGAVACANDALAITRVIGSRWDTAAALRLLGDVARDRGELDDAATIYREILNLGWQDGNTREVADALSGIGSIAVVAGDMPQAARLLGAAETLYRRLEIALPPPLRPDWDTILTRIRNGLPADQFTLSWGSLTPEQAIAEITGDRLLPA